MHPRDLLPDRVIAAGTGWAQLGRNVSAVQPLFAAIEVITAHSGP
jgi:hypothetical protein